MKHDVIWMIIHLLKRRSVLEIIIEGTMERENVKEEQDYNIWGKKRCVLKTTRQK